MKTAVLLAFPVIFAGILPDLEHNRFRSKQYYPSANYSIVNQKITNKKQLKKNEMYRLCKEFVNQNHGIPTTSITTSGHCDKAGICTCYVGHQYKDKIISNHHGTVTIARGTVKSYSINFKNEYNVTCTSSITHKNAIKSAEHELKLKKSSAEQEVYYQVDPEFIEPALQFQMKDNVDFISVVVSLCDAELLEIVNFVSYF